MSEFIQWECGGERGGSQHGEDSQEEEGRSQGGENSQEEKVDVNEGSQGGKDPQEEKPQEEVARGDMGSGRGMGMGRGGMKRVREDTEDGKPSKKTRGDPQFGGVSAEMMAMMAEEAGFAEQLADEEELLIEAGDEMDVYDAAEEVSCAGTKEETAKLSCEGRSQGGTDTQEEEPQEDTEEGKPSKCLLDMFGAHSDSGWDCWCDRCTEQTFNVVKKEEDGTINIREEAGTINISEEEETINNSEAVGVEGEQQGQQEGQQQEGVMQEAQEVEVALEGQVEEERRRRVLPGEEEFCLTS